MSWFDFGIYALLTLFILVCSLLILLILMQRSRNDGIGSAIASGMTQQYLGAQTNSFLVKGTVWLTLMFFGLSLLLDHLYTQHARTQADQLIKVQDALNKAVPTPTPTPTPAPVVTKVPSPVAVVSGPTVSGKPSPSLTPAPTPTPGVPKVVQPNAPPVPLPPHN